MVTNLHMLAYSLNLLSIKHYLVQFWAKFWTLLRTLSAWASYKLLDSLQLKAFIEPMNRNKFNITYLLELKANFNTFLPIF